jgi:ABC-type glutathione transport system ATPase component
VELVKLVPVQEPRGTASHAEATAADRRSGREIARQPDRFNGAVAELAGGPADRPSLMACMNRPLPELHTGDRLPARRRSVSAISPQYPDLVAADGVSVRPPTAVLMIVGSSGCGKITLLHILPASTGHPRYDRDRRRIRSAR